MIGFLIGVILFGFTIAGATFAYFVSEAETGSKTLAEANKFKVIIDEDKNVEIDGALTLGVSKEEGLMGQIGVSMESTSVLSKGNLYFDIIDMSTNKLLDNTYWNRALKWELYGKNSQGVYSQLDSGDFMECSTTKTKRCVNGDKLYILNDFQLTYEFQYFDVYVWLDGNIADNGVKDAKIKATISVETEDFSADLDQRYEYEKK